MNLQPMLVNIDLSTVDVHPNLQRPVNELHVRRIVRDFNSDAFGILTVAPRADVPGRFWVVAGGHRAEAAKRMGVTHVLCVVMSDSSDQAMAQAYMDEQTQRNQHPTIKHRIALVAGDPVATGTDDVCTEHGFHIPTTGGGNTYKSRGTVACIKPLYALYGDGVLGEALEILNDAFDASFESAQGWLIAPLGKFLVHKNDCVKDGMCKYDRQSFITALRRTGVPDLRSAINARKSFTSETNAFAGADVLIGIYNKGKRTGRIPSLDYAEYTRKAKSAGKNPKAA